MYSETDIENAVATGAITPAAAAALRESVARDRASPAVDEESFRLITGFNDIFVSIAAILLLVAIGWIGFSLVGPHGDFDEKAAQGLVGHGVALAGLLVAGASWGLAEYFTRQRRMALPSIILLGAFVAAVGACLFGLAIPFIPEQHGEQFVAGVVSGVGVLTAGATYFHWRRFHVPITIAALTAALVGTLLATLLWAVPEAQDSLLWLLLATGIGVFGFAMWWDRSDRVRQTRRSDVAFWLHLAAAPMIAHPVFHLLGVMNNEVTAATGLIVILLYIAFGVIALAVDRRALLVSSLAYVLFALDGLFRQAGAVSLSIALTALVIGSALLLLSAFWHSARRLVVSMLPGELQAGLPALDRPVLVTPRPI
ncbi:MAG TPA: hypothetical protein VK533_08000 [Sphingomonas sp.]|uniref:hypothetical protein n=1 Tax=Sphingomonas sp. TaxID=28214 RepID=UPI002C0173CE|nr:hypothetical protein [Sphingomonas sp.]HMI19471.1 hypothetical protein [Sphingomonas sp.]